MIYRLITFVLLYVFSFATDAQVDSMAIKLEKFSEKCLEDTFSSSQIKICQYSEDETIKSLCLADSNGIVLNFKLYFPNGETWVEISTTDHQQTKEIRYYYHTGELKARGVFVNTLNNEWRLVKSDLMFDSIDLVSYGGFTFDLLTFQLYEFAESQALWVW